MSSDEEIDDLIATLVGIRAKKPWEFAMTSGDNAAWYSPDPDLTWKRCFELKYRIRLKPCVPLGPEDVPPGSVIRWLEHAQDDRDTSTGGWATIIAVGDFGITSIMGDNTLEDIAWETLVTDAEILRPNQTWEPCYKELA